MCTKRSSIGEQILNSQKTLEMENRAKNHNIVIFKSIPFAVNMSIIVELIPLTLYLVMDSTLVDAQVCMQLLISALSAPL